jgi:hypothetical protein
MIDTTATPTPEAVQLAADLNSALLARQLTQSLRDRYGVEVIIGPDAVTLRKHGNSNVLKGSVSPRALRNTWEQITRH